MGQRSPPLCHKWRSHSGVSPAHLSIGITAYLVTLAIFIPISGWIADRFGARTVFGTAIAVFTIASVFCGVSSGLIQFILARILQGIGGAMMVPVGRVVVLRSTPKNQLIRAIATITWPGLIATVIGPPVGGFITTFSWHWIFLINARSVWPASFWSASSSPIFVPKNAGRLTLPDSCWVRFV